MAMNRRAAQETASNQEHQLSTDPITRGLLVLLLDPDLRIGGVEALVMVENDDVEQHQPLRTGTSPMKRTPSPTAATDGTNSYLIFQAWNANFKINGKRVLIHHKSNSKFFSHLYSNSTGRVHAIYNVVH